MKLTDNLNLFKFKMKIFGVILTAKKIYCLFNIIFFSLRQSLMAENLFGRINVLLVKSLPVFYHTCTMFNQLLYLSK